MGDGAASHLCSQEGEEQIIPLQTRSVIHRLRSIPRKAHHNFSMKHHEKRV